MNNLIDVTFCENIYSMFSTDLHLERKRIFLETEICYNSINSCVVFARKQTKADKACVETSLETLFDIIFIDVTICLALRSYFKFQDYR